MLQYATMYQLPADDLDELDEVNKFTYQVVLPL